MKKTELKWRIVRIQGSRAAEICTLNARTEDAAIKQFEITTHGSNSSWPHTDGNDRVR